MRYFDGNMHAEKLDEIIKNKIVALKKVPKLGIIQIGDNPTSEKYISLKIKKCKSLNIPFEYLKLPFELEDSDILIKTKDFVSRSDINGIIIQLPIPRGSLESILDLIPIEKDLDGLSVAYKDKFYSNSQSFNPPIIRSLEYFLGSEDIKMEGKTATILGLGRLVGMPIYHYLSVLKANIEVLDDSNKMTVSDKLSYKINIKSQYIQGKKLEGKLLILSAGQPNLVFGEDINAGANVVDFGSSISKGKTLGDLNLNSRLDHLNVISPSPGGMGPLVIRFLLLNLLENTI